MLKAPEFKQSRETQIIYDLFCDIGKRHPALITYRELEQATKKPKHQLRGPISTAIRRCRSHDSLVIDCDRNIGYRLVEDREHQNVMGKRNERSRRNLEVSHKIAKCTQISKLSPEERVGHYLQSSITELSLIPSRPRARANVKQEVMRKHNELDDHEMLQAIKDALMAKR